MSSRRSDPILPARKRVRELPNVLTTPIVDMSGEKDILQYLQQLRKQGYDYRRNGNGHYQITFEDMFVTTAPSTPKGGHGRALANLKARVRRFNRTNHIHPKNRHTAPGKG